MHAKSFADTEVRGQNSFMRKILLIHAVTMGLLLAGMFGLSMAAMELSKETKVGAEGALVSQQGDAVLVGSSDTQIVTGANGSPQLRQRRSSDERRLGESDDDIIRVGLAEKVVLDLDEGDDQIDDGNQTDQSRRLGLDDLWSPVRKYEILTKLNYKKCKTFMQNLKRSSFPNDYTLAVAGAEFGGSIWSKERKVNQKVCRFITHLYGEGTMERITVRCENKNRGRKPCSIFFKKRADSSRPFLLDDGEALCWKKGVCPKDVYARAKEFSYDSEGDPGNFGGTPETDYFSEEYQDALIEDDSPAQWSDPDKWLVEEDEMAFSYLRKASYRLDDEGKDPFGRTGEGFKGCTDSNFNSGARDKKGWKCYDYWDMEPQCGDHDDEDFTAKESCCACWGGDPTCFDTKHNGDETATDCGGSCSPCEDDRRTKAPKASYIRGILQFGDCACYKSWRTYDGILCDDYCCNPDGAKYGNWCHIKAGDCQGRTWGYCADPSPSRDCD